MVEKRADERGGQGKPGRRGRLRRSRQQRGRQAFRQHDSPERRARIRAAETREGFENGELLTERLLDAEAGEALPQHLERRDRRLQGTRDDLRADGLDIRRSRLLGRFEQIVVRKRLHGCRGRPSHWLRDAAGYHPAAFGEQVQLVRRRFPVRTQGAGLRRRGAGVRWLHH